MFGRKKPSHKRGMTLILLDNDKKILTSCPISDYVLPEKVVLSLSEEYFNDPEPCEIHRGAVHNRVMMEITDLCAPGMTKPLAELPEHARAWFPEGAASIRIAEESR